jgi:hypothetical protein
VFYVAFQCADCKSSGLDATLNTYVGQYEGEPIFDVTCVNGHKYQLVLQNPKFEILFESACYSFADKYYREAALTAAASLEDYIRTHTNSLLRVSGVSASKIEEMSRRYSLSERQYGAFQCARLALGDGIVEDIYQQNLPGRKEKYIEVRNKCAHAGAFIGEELALAVLYFVYNKIRQLTLSSAEAGKYIHADTPGYDLSQKNRQWITFDTVLGFSGRGHPSLMLDEFRNKILHSHEFRNQIHAAVKQTAAAQAVQSPPQPESSHPAE